ncbi:dynamin-1-like [Centruroides sculpturatus]|uniref:dynamin-1-like n=1 Tax=Centruroides sculpturatus TaxID=218467 RepID=UPI000C6DCE19|nr:dynamin-1-like [Centruroides sculpturatus]
MSNGKSTNEGMEDLIILVNSIQDLLTPLNLNFTVQLPQIAVVGAQSVGKSSVLENIVGREFIPRGKDIVTRRPLIIQLINSDEEYGLFLHKPDEVYTDFNAICKEIQDETDRELGKQKNVSTKPINLKIYSPHVVNLTLVDLPGLTKVPVGDQPSNIDEIIHKMVRDFVESDHTLILAVSSATQDIATSDALKVAREVDPRGERTIGILTHLDLMSPGTNACDVLENRVFSLKRGYVGVVNRSQDDIEKRKDIKYGLQKEEEFFLSTKCYRDMADRMGIKYLQRLLNSQLKCHIKERIPNIRQSLYQNLIKFRNELGAYQDNYDDTDASRIGFILQLVNKFIEHFKTSLLGFSENIELESINAGSLINKSLYNEVIKKMKIEMNITEDNIMRAILNNNAIRTGLLVPQLAFDCLCKESIERYKVPLSEAISYIKDLMFNAVESSASLVSFFRL